jgi:protein phosphatase
MKLEAAALTDPGRQRDINEDRAWAQVFEASEGGPMGLFIVCDGMGGHLGGEVASHWAVETLKSELVDLFFSKDPRATLRLSDAEIKAIVEGSQATRISPATRIETQIRKAIEKANQVLLNYAQKRPEKAAEAGTTLTMAVVSGRRLVVANVGDSRTYLMRNGKLQQITQDHSLVATLVASGQIQPKEVFSHPQRNMIYRSLGQKRQIQIDTYGDILQPGDTLLLCSDGLWEMVRDEAIMANLIGSAASLERACQKLIDAANQAGGEDNISVVLVKAT